MKKVMITISTLYGGGAERVVSIWANQLQQQGYDVSILIYGRGEGEYPVSDGIKIYTVADTYSDYQRMGYIERFCRMRRLIKNEHPDVMINFLPRMQTWVLFASAFIKTFRIETVRVSPWEVCKNSRIEKFLWKMCFKVADAVILQTKEQGDYFGNRVINKSIVIPNPISDQCVKSCRSGYTSSPRLFIAAGRLTTQKNYPLMIDAFAKAYQKNPNIRLSIYGAGTGLNDPYPERLQKQIDDLGLRDIVKLEGRTNKIIDMYLNSDGFIMSSDFEGMPNALAEAMACGLVCISTNCKTGPKDMIDNNQNGFLVNMRNVDELADAIVFVSTMKKEEAEAIGNAARNTILSMCSEENSKRKLMRLIDNGELS